MRWSLTSATTSLGLAINNGGPVSGIVPRPIKGQAEVAISRHVAPLRTGQDLIQSLKEALAHTNGEGAAVVHEPVLARDIGRRTKRSSRNRAGGKEKPSGGYKLGL